MPAQRQQLSVAWSGVMRVTMQAAASSDMQSEHAQTSTEAPLEAASTSAAAEGDGSSMAVLTPGAVADVEELCGVRVKVDDLGQPLVEYLVHWKVSSSREQVQQLHEAQRTVL